MADVASITPSEILSRFNTLGTNALKAPSAPPSVVSNLQQAASNAAQSVNHLAAAGNTIAQSAAQSVGIAGGNIETKGLLEKFKNKYLTPRNIAIVLLVVGGIVGMVYLYFEYKKRRQQKQQQQMKEADEQAKRLIEEANQKMKQKQIEQQKEQEQQKQHKQKEQEQKQKNIEKKKQKQQKEQAQKGVAPAVSNTIPQEENDPDFTLLSELQDIV